VTALLTRGVDGDTIQIASVVDLSSNGQEENSRQSVRCRGRHHARPGKPFLSNKSRRRMSLMDRDDDTWPKFSSQSPLTCPSRRLPRAASNRRPGDTNDKIASIPRHRDDTP
jgi:hypothetical protein